MKNTTNESQWLLIIFLIAGVIGVFSQDFYKKFDDITGFYNQEIFNGIVYKNNIVFDKKDSNTFNDGIHSIAEKSYHSFFLEGKFLLSDVRFNGQPYKIKIKYNLLKDVLIAPYKNINISYPIELNPDFTDEFVYNGHKFIKLKKMISIANIYKNGFFEEKFKSDKIGFYIKRQIKLLESKKGTILRYKVRPRNILVLLYKGKFYTIKRKKDILKVLPSYKNEYKSYFNNRKLTQDNFLGFIKKYIK